MYYLVLRPLLDFYFSSCGVCSMPLRWKNALLIMIIIIVLALWLKNKNKTKKKRHVLLNVVQIALEMLCFFKESTNLSDGPFYSSHRQMGIKQPANQSRCLMTKMSSVMTDFQNKYFCLSSVLLWRFECKKAAFESNSTPCFHTENKSSLKD